jgi:hypothetical protein
MRYAVDEGKIVEFKGLTGKSLETKEIALARWISPLTGPIDEVAKVAQAGWRAFDHSR